MQGNLSWYFAHILTSFLKLYLYIRQRYGNPEYQILGTLNTKLQIYRFLDMPNKNLGSDVIFRAAIYLQKAKIGNLWQP